MAINGQASGLGACVAFGMQINPVHIEALLLWKPTLHAALVSTALTCPIGALWHWVCTTTELIVMFEFPKLPD
jgi:hypothetical protein